MLEYYNEKKIKKDGKTYRQVTAICACGVHFTAYKSNITGGQRSCGCKKGNIKHGMTRTRPYRAWRNMLDRCNNPKNKHWKDYGGRGIKVCKEWMTFANFWNDMKWTYDDYLTLERRDNNYHYCKINCRWATQEEQAANKRNSIVYKGETARQAGIRINGNPSIVYQRLNAGWDIHTAFTKTSRRPKNMHLAFL